MSLWSSTIRPLLFRIDAEKTHELALFGLGTFAATPLRHLAAKHLRTRDPILAQELWGQHFENPFGLTAGMDKQAKALRGWESIGFGYMEIGSITNQPQPGNPKPRMWRLPEDQSIVVYLGLPSLGAEAMRDRIAKVRPKLLGRMRLGISLAKTRITPSEQAPEDYVASYKLLAPLADFVVINLSCPNVEGFTNLQSCPVAKAILEAVGKENDATLKKPLLVKIGPDFSPEELDALGDVLFASPIDGIICTNLRKKTRPELKTKKTDFPGGISGRPLQELADETLALLARKRTTRTADARPVHLIGVGGVFTAEDAYRKIRLGANLVSLATGFIYGGPLKIKQLNDGLAKLLRNDGFANIRDAVGADL